MNGSVFKRCPCTEKPGKGKAVKQTRSCKKEHGSWYFVHDVPTADGRRPQIKRGGYPGKEEAEEALNKSLVRYGQRGIGAERDLASGRQTVADYLRGWIDRRRGLKASTKRSYRMHIETHLVPVLGTIRLDELGTGHIDAAYEQLRQPRPRPSGERKRRAAAAAEAPCRQDGKARLGRGELRRQIRSFMAERPGEDFAPHEVSRALGRGRNCGAVRQRLARLAADGEILEVCPRPRRYSYDPGRCTIPATVEAVTPASVRQLSAASLRRIHSTLRTALSDAVRKRVLDYNPAIYAELDPAEPPRVRYWTHEEAGHFLDSIVDDPLYAIYHLAVYRGLRRGELIALRWADLDLDEGLLEVRRNIVQLGGQTEEGTPKSQESQRLLALDADTATVLRAHRERQQKLFASLGIAWSKDGFVFVTPDGTALNPDYVSRHLAVLIRAAGVSAVTLHQLRHTAASLMLEAGADLKYVQHVLGHSSIYITAKLYVHITRRLDLKRSSQVASLIPRKRLVPSAGGDLPTPA